MKVFRITDLGSDIAERETYKLLENINTFTLIECNNIRLPLAFCAHTDVLFFDHFDQSPDPSLLLEQIGTTKPKLRAIVLIDSDPEFNPPVFSRLDISIHVIFNAYKEGVRSQQTIAHKHHLLIEHLHQVKEFAA